MRGVLPAVDPSRYPCGSPPPPAASDERGPFSGESRGAHESVAEPLPERTAPVALREAILVQKETLAALDRAERNMNEAEQLGEEAKTQLQRDDVIIEVIDTKLDRNESVLEEMRRSMRHFAVQLMKDRLFVALFSIAIVLFVAAIGVKIYFMKKS